jgi:adenylylsulfate kinase-like enzyme
MSKLIPPKRKEVKIWFQGVSGSGKSLLQDLIVEALKARGIKVRCYDRRLDGKVAMREQVVDLTNQNIHDVLTIEIDITHDLEKLRPLHLTRAAE